MLAAVSLATLLLTSAAPHQEAVKEAVGLVKDIEPGASSAAVEARAAPLGPPRVAFMRCSQRGTHECVPVPEARATKRIASWGVSDRKLVVTFCGRPGAWKMAALILSSADHIDVTGVDPAALVWKYDSDLAATCESADK